jgi:hypothetical protein
MFMVSVPQELSRGKSFKRGQSAEDRSQRTEHGKQIAEDRLGGAGAYSCCNMCYLSSDF